MDVKIVLNFRIFSFHSVVDCSGANPCLNGGTCDTDTCTCAAGFNGALCNTGMKNGWYHTLRNIGILHILSNKNLLYSSYSCLRNN